MAWKKSTKPLNIQYFFILYHSSIQGDEKHAVTHCTLELTWRRITPQLLSVLKAKAFLMSEQVWQMSARRSLTACLSSRLWQAWHQSKYRQSALSLLSSLWYEALACALGSHFLNLQKLYRSWEKCKKAFYIPKYFTGRLVMAGHICKFPLMPSFSLHHHSRKHLKEKEIQYKEQCQKRFSCTPLTPNPNP